MAITNPAGQAIISYERFDQLLIAAVARGQIDQPTADIHRAQYRSTNGAGYTVEATEAIFGVDGTPPTPTPPTPTPPAPVNPPLIPGAGGNTAQGARGPGALARDQYGRADAFADQPAQTAFTRYLMGLEGGTPFAAPVRNAIESRGQFAADLAPLFGYGLQRQLGGQGSDFSPFFQQYGLQPDYEQTRRALGNVATALSTTSRTPFQEYLAQSYGQPGEQRDVLESFLLSQANPAVRAALGRSLSNVYRRQQAAMPEQQFLQYAQGQGWF